MDNELFSHITSDYYIRRYELDPKFTGGIQVTIYAECSPIVIFPIADALLFNSQLFRKLNLIQLS